METPNINYRGDVCVKFWYHMYGEAVGSLQVYTKNRGTNSPWRTINGNQGNNWIQQQVDVSLGDNNRVNS